MSQNATEAEHLAMVLYRVRALAGDAVPGGRSVLVLSDIEHADNVEVALKHIGAWEHGDEHVRDWLRKKRERVAAEHAIYEGDDAIPGPGEPVGAAKLDLISCNPAMPWGSNAALYLAKALERKRGRRPSLLTPEERKKQRGQLIKQWEDDGITLELIASLKRHHLFMLASHVGIPDPGHRGDNKVLRKAIAKSLGLR